MNIRKFKNFIRELKVKVFCDKNYFRLYNFCIYVLIYFVLVIEL